MQKILQSTGNSRSQIDCVDAAELTPADQAYRRAVLYCGFACLWLIVLAAIFTLNEWIGLAIQALALSSSLLIQRENTSGLSSPQVEYAEGYGPCPAEKIVKR